MNTVIAYNLITIAHSHICIVEELTGNKPSFADVKKFTLDSAVPATTKLKDIWAELEYAKKQIFSIHYAA